FHFLLGQRKGAGLLCNILIGAFQPVAGPITGKHPQHDRYRQDDLACLEHKGPRLIYHGVSDVLPPWPPIRRKFHDKIAALADANDLFHYPRREYSHAEAKQVQSHKDRKSTRLNSSHVKISYAVFCLKKKKQNNL